ncbi:MAG: response regulator [Deltaproteobacteria bacterium]|nr:response regulator [Deltaproteobacteria bacterium]
MKIMVVDDDSYMADVIAAFLKKNSCEVIIYSGMSDGLRHMMEEKVDAVILDFHMPGMNAIEAVPIVREINPNAVVGVISSDTSAGVKIAALKAGADFFMQKWNEIPNIMKEINKVRSKQLAVNS